MSFCSSGHWCQVNIALVHAIINSGIPNTSFTPTCANTIPAYIAAHLDNVHSLGEHKFLSGAKDWDAFCAFLQGLEQQTCTKFTVDAKRMSHGRLLIKQTCMYGNKPSWTERKNLSNRLYPPLSLLVSHHANRSCRVLQRFLQNKAYAKF
jgi:hypothetical protein